MHCVEERFNADNDKLSINIIKVHPQPCDIDQTHRIVKKNT